MAAKSRISKSVREGLLRKRKGAGVEKPNNIASPPAPTAPAKPQVEAPEELAIIWEDEVIEAWLALDKRRQDFLLVYIRTGNAAEAYRKAYNPLAGAHLASMGGNQVLSGIGMEAILAKFTEQRTADFLLVQKTLREMAEAVKAEWVQNEDDKTWENVGDVPDWKARKDAADGLAKLRGLNAPVEANLNIQAKVALVELPVKKALP